MLVTSSKEQKNVIKSLSTCSQHLEEKNHANCEKLDELEQYDRRHNLIFEGEPYEDGEDASQILMDVAKALEVEVERKDISIAHRLPTQNSRARGPCLQHPAIIARFANREVKNLVCSKRFQARNIKKFYDKNGGIIRKRKSDAKS